MGTDHLGYCIDSLSRKACRLLENTTPERQHELFDHKRAKISPAARLPLLQIICGDALYREQTLMLLRI